MARGGNAQDRRRGRRAAERRTAQGLENAPNRTATVTIEQEYEILELVAAASGSTTLPLSDQGATWDGAAADKAVRAWADAEEKPNAKYASAFFWKNSDGGDAFGDYKLGFADVVDGKLTAIWKGVTAAAGAIQGARGGVDIPSGDVAGVKAKIAGYYAKAAKQYKDDGIKPPWEANESAGQSAAFLLAYAETIYAEDAPHVLDVFYAEDGETPIGVGGSGPRMDDFLARRAYWEHEFAAPEDRALALLDAHSAQEIALSLLAAVGDVAWGPEEGFVDLLADVNEALGSYGDTPSMYLDAELGPCCSRPYAVDVSVNLDKVIICDGDDYYVAPIAVDADGEPALAPREQWTPVESGWVEVPPEEDEALEAAGTTRAASRIRATLREFAFADTTDPMLPDAHKPGSRIPRRNAVPVEPTPPVGASAGGPLEWTAIFVPEGTLTDDGRAFAPDSLSWRELPLTLMAMTETSEGGHIGAEVAGRIDRIWQEGNLIKASGVFDSGDYGQEIARMVADGVLRGLSVDIAIHEYEVGPRSDYFDADGNWLVEKPMRAEQDDADLLDMLFGDETADRIFVVTKGVIGMATVCPFPAFAQANIALVASGAVWRYTHQAVGFTIVERPGLAASAVPADGEWHQMTKLGDEVYVDGKLVATLTAATLTAAAAGLAPLKPPAEWFADPGLTELTPLTITEDGRVYGHAWGWGTCHLSFEGCVVAPHTQTANAYFHLGEVECADGELVPVGKITIDAPHAGQRLSRAEAIRHYDHTGTVAAHIVCGEDEHGGWFAGAIHPELSAEKLRLLRGSSLSGDWRAVNHNLELIAMLAVNVPGFPVPRTRALVASAEDGSPELLSLTAAGIVRQPPTAEQEAEIRALAEQAREVA